jgi:hypothetical protein
VRSRSDFRVLQLVLRTAARPHASCTVLAGAATGTGGSGTGIGNGTGTGAGGSVGGKQQPVWQTTLYFEDRMQCSSAADYLERGREKLRRQMMAQLAQLLASDD